jgi:hypothetical protein
VLTILDVVGNGKKPKKNAPAVPVLVDFLQFIDAVVEIHGDPFYELRYRCAVAWGAHLGALRH